MIVNSPFSNSHKKTDIISTPLKEINVIVSPLKQQSFSERRNSKSNSFHSFDLKKIEKNSLKLHFENKKSNVKEPTTQSLLKNRNSDRSSKEITEFNKNFEICKKFNILLEKNETLNEILEKKIEKLGNCSKENSCLLQEISILQQQNLKLELEVEGLNAKVGFLDKEIEIKQQEDLEKNDIISEFRDLIKQLEKEMVLLREEEHNGKTDFEVKSAEIEQMKKDLMKKQRLEGQLIIFIKENEKLRKIIEETNEENIRISSKMFDITTRESQLLELQQELKEKRKIIEEKDTLLEKTLKELEIINETLNKQSQDILDLEKSKKEAYRDVSELQIAQKVFIEENNVLKESNEKLYEKFTECETQIKGFKIKINDLQNSHLNIAKNHNEKIGEMQKKIEESLKWREEAKKLEECIKGYKEKLIQSEEIIENLNLSLKNNNNENIELNEKMKIKIKGYSILKSHFYTKYEEIIKLLIQKDKQLEMFKMKNIRNEFNEKENKIKTVEFYELFKKNKKENGENNDLENEINKDLLMLKDDKLFEKVVLEPIDTNNIK